jgi:hypothetical protein
MLSKDKDDVLGDYMELTKQFGYVMFFSSIFPIAGALSMICNYFEMNQAVRSFKYKKKYKAEVSQGIGNFTHCLNMIGTFSIMLNAFLICFTSKVFKKLFTGTEYNWELAYFFTFIFLIEHAMMIIKTLIEFSIDYNPEYIKQGEMEKQVIADELWNKIEQQRAQLAKKKNLTEVIRTAENESLGF